MDDTWGQLFSYFVRRKSTLYFCLLAGLGGVAPDFDHFLSWVTSGKVEWAFLHQPDPVRIIWWVFVASLAGLFATLLLGYKRG